MLKALELSGLTPTRNNRSDKEPLVILGGEGLVNPLPFTPFADITVVGDGEEALLKTLAELSDKNSKEAKLQKLTQARIPGVYVSAYPPEIGSFRSAHIKYNQQRYPPGSVVVKDGVSSLVINKGCRYHCGFCQYTHTHGLQQRRFRDLTEHMQLLKNAGAKTLVLISAAASNYFYKDENGVKQTISDIVKAAKELELEPVLSADRPEDAELILQATTPNKVVFAPEASPELRQVVLGKTIAENDLLRAIESSIQHGVPTVNLFAIVGIPGETAGDLNYFVDLSSKIIEMFHQSAVPNPLINLHIMPLLASPYTPLDTAAMVTYSEYMEKVNWVRNQIPIQFRKFINVYPNITETHFMTEVLFKRGDADIGLVFLALFRQLKNGEQVNPDDLRSFLTRQGYNFEDFLSAKTTDDLPRIMSIH